jgi:hypothetical protein
MTESHVLALDTSTKCGWAGDPPLGETIPVSGTLKLGRWDAENIEHSYAMLHRFIVGYIANCGATDVVIERPLSVYAHAGFQKGRRGVNFQGDARKSAELGEALLGFVAVAQTAALIAGAKPWLVSSSTVRKHFIGNGRAPDPKAAVMFRCRQLGWNFEDDNAADALATWDYAKSLLSPGWAWKGTPLLAKA